MIKPTFTPCGEIFYITAGPHVQACSPVYEPLQVSKCGKYGKVIAELNEIIEIGNAKEMLETKPP